MEDVGGEDKEAIAPEVDLLVQARNEAKKRGDYDEANAIATRLCAMGVLVERDAHGTVTWRWQEIRPKKMGRIVRRTGKTSGEALPAECIRSAMATEGFAELVKEGRLSFDPEAYPFEKIIREGFGLADEIPLSKLHCGLLGDSFDSETSCRTAKKKLLRPLGPDQPTRHELNALYDRFICEVVAPHVAACLPSDRILYGQCCVRVQPPAAKPIGVPHCDSHYGHQAGQINFWLPLMDVDGACSLHVESAPGARDYHPLQLQYGECARFYGNRCTHFTVANTTNITRVSLDFRVVPGPVFDPDPEASRGKDGSQRFTVASDGFGKNCSGKAYYRECCWDEERGSYAVL